MQARGPGFSPHSDCRPVGKAPAVFLAMSSLQNTQIGGYTALKAVELPVHRGNPGSRAMGQHSALVQQQVARLGNVGGNHPVTCVLY